MDGNASVRTKDRNKKNAEIERLHEKTFRAWANSQLRQRNVKLEQSLAESFQDGLMLIALVEVLSGEKCQGKYHKVPEKDIHKLENITIAIEFVSKFVRPLNVNSNDILQKNLKVILGLVWRLILTFQVEGEETEETKDMSSAQRNKLAKQKLLKWCQDTTAGHKYVNIENFQGSWFDGMGFCALVHAIDPSLIDYDSLTPANAKANLQLAFDLAEKHFDIPQLLDPEDICADDVLSKPDEQCFMTYLSAFPVALLQRKSSDRSAELEKLKREEEEARRRAEAEAARKIKEAEEAARRQAEEEARKREAAADARRLAEEEERRRREAEHLKEVEESAKEKARRKAEKKAEKEAHRRAKEEEERKRLAEMDEAKRLAEEEAREREFEAERQRLKEENERLKKQLLDTKTRLIGKLHVRVHEARNMKKNVDAYCTMFLEKQKDQTKTIKKTKEPKWNAAHEFYVSDPKAALELTIFNRHWLFADEALGYVQVEVATLEDGEEVEKWFSLKKKGKKDKHDAAKKTAGEIRLGILYTLEK